MLEFSLQSFGIFQSGFIASLWPFGASSSHNTHDIWGSTVIGGFGDFGHGGQNGHGGGQPVPGNCWNWGGSWNCGGSFGWGDDHRGHDHGNHHDHHHDKPGHCGGETCFLAGAMIETPEGTVAVETLRAGDEVVAYRDGMPVSETLIWVGRASMVTHGAPSDRSGHAVLVRRDAVAPGMPDRDLRVTAEHCFLFDGRFVPVRLLVNGTTIAFDADLAEYEYFHIETATHAVIRANNMLTESYLDTGNRMLSNAGDNVVTLRGPALSWTADAAAPLDTSRAFVEPLHEAIRTRAATLGFVGASDVMTTDDADLRLETQDGRVIRPTRVVNGRAVFALPAGVESVDVVSRASRPCDAIGPFVDDRRELGVLVGAVKLFDSDATKATSLHLEDAGLAGWHGVEAPTMRWTTGRATLPLGARAPHAVGTLVVEVVSAGPYVVEADAAPLAYAC
jgi:antigen 43